jgi:hypothetical protein
MCWLPVQVGRWSPDGSWRMAGKCKCVTQLQHLKSPENQAYSRFALREWE